MKILVPTDGSDFSRAAIEQACQIAMDQKEAEIKVFSVYEPHQPIAAEPFAVSAEFHAELDKIGKTQAEGWAKEAADQVRSALNGAGVTVTTSVENGDPAKLIVDAASSWGADLVVMGSHGRGFWGRLTLGSVSDAVLHHVPCSVLITKKASG